MATITYDIPNISCKHCMHTITTELTDLAGVKSIKGDIGARRLTISYEAPATPETIRQLLTDINYPPAAVKS